MAKVIARVIFLRNSDTKLWKDFTTFKALDKWLTANAETVEIVEVHYTNAALALYKD
jgi:hypothetical protein